MQKKTIKSMKEISKSYERETLENMKKKKWIAKS